LTPWEAEKNEMEKEIVNNDDIEVAISESKEFKDKLSSIYLKHKDSSINFLTKYDRN